MGLLDLALAPLRRLAGAVEHEVVERTTVDDRILDGVEAVRRATDSIERHVEVIETLATSLPPLTESVTRLTEQLNQLMALTAPLAAAEREVSRLEHLFGRHRHHPDDPLPPGAAPPA
jgi:hypothetical protein